MSEVSVEARISSEFPTFGLRLFNKAMAAGYGEEEVAALIKVMRGVPNRRGRYGQERARLSARVVMYMPH